MILDSFRYAARQHSGQFRKGKEASPYINHLIDVAHILWYIGGVRDIDVIAAGILHDTVEDTDTTEADIARDFGPGIASVVMEVTDDKSLLKRERKRLQIEHAATLSFEAKLVKLADKISNVSEIIEHPPAKWSVKRLHDYIDWGEKVIDRLRGTNQALEHHFDTIARKAREKLNNG